MVETRPAVDRHVVVAKRALELFEAHRASLLDLPPAERPARASTLTDEPLVASELLRLCALTTSGSAETLAVPVSPRDLGPGSLFAQRYRILRKLGEGAAAVVYLAEQQGPLRRQVAIKLLLSDLHSPQAAHRFQSECEALARMNHPSIASLHDAGRTREGLPYVIMEYVDGEPIDLHARNRHLGVRQRAELMARVCRGVHHAHQKGIIHRDLKPGNVLVAYRDGQSLPKIIDFGIARITSTVLPRATVSGLFVGTPGYMSPEQAGVGEADVDTISDIYSLGVIFYELLTGVLPLLPAAADQGAPESAGASVNAWRRLLAAEDPIRPSAQFADRRARTTFPEAAAIPLGIDPRDIGTDLDSVVMKALARERDRRYSSASEFAADIERVLSGEPVLARAPSFTYQLWRLLRRHAALTASLAVLLVTALVSAFIIADLMAQRTAEAEQVEIAREHARAEREIAWERQVIAERMTARGNLAYARVALELGDAGTARRNLEAIPAQFRGWEWRWIIEQSDRSTAAALGHYGPVRILAPTATGELLVSGGDDGTVRLWRARDLAALAVVQAHALPVSSLTVTQDASSLIAISSDGRSVVATDLATGRESWRRAGVDIRFGSASLSADGERLIVAEGEGEVGLFDAITGHRLGTFDVGTSKVLEVGFGPLGMMIFSHRNFIRILEADGTVRATVFGRLSSVSPSREVIGFAPLSRWDDRGVTSLMPLAEPAFLERASALDELAVGDQGEVIAADNLNTLYFRTSGPSSSSLRVLGHGSVITGLALATPSEAVFSADAGGVIKRWDTATQPVPFAVPSSNDVIYGARVSPDEELMATTGWGTAKLWDTRTGAEVATHWWSRAYSTAVAFAPSGMRLAAADWRGRVTVLAVPSLTPVATHQVTAERITALHWHTASPAPDGPAATDRERADGLLVIGTSAGELIAIDPLRGDPKWRRMAHPGAPIVCISAHGDVLATAAGSEGVLPDFDRGKENHIPNAPYIQRTDAYTGAPIGQALPESGPYASLAWSPSGHELAAGAEDGTVTVWTMPDGRLRQRKPGVGSGIFALTWSRSGKRIIIGHETGAIIIADASSLELLVTLPRAPVDIAALVATRDGRALLAAGRETPLVAYEIEPRASPAAREAWARRRAAIDARLAEAPGLATRPASSGLTPEEASLIEARGINPNILNSEAWGVALAEKQKPADFALARQKAEVAASGWPVWQFENTRALARLRDGDPIGALDSVERGVRMQREAGLENHPSDWAIAAIASQALRRPSDAARLLALAEKEADTPMWRGDAEVWQLIDEARQTVRGSAVVKGGPGR